MAANYHILPSLSILFHSLDYFTLILTIVRMHHALIIPGIQDTPEDWQELRTLLQSEVQLYHSPRPAYDDSSDEQWLDTITQHHLNDAARHDCDIVVGHSFGCRMAIDALMHTHNLKAGILIAPSKNNPPPMPEVENPKGSTDNMMRPIAFDMGQEKYWPFVERHTEAMTPLSRKRIRAEFRLIKKSTDLMSTIQKYERPAPIIVLHSPKDPWHIDELGNYRSANILVEFLRDADHYPHVGRPETIAKIIREWLCETGLSETPVPLAKSISA